MSCRFARVDADGLTGCELLHRGGWQQAAALAQLRLGGVAAREDSPLCPVAVRGQWLRCPCLRAPAPPALAPVRL